MPRNATLQFGLLPIPIKIDSTIAEPKEATFSTVCVNGHDPVKVKSQGVACPVCDNADPAHFAKGQDLGDTIVTVSPEDVKAARESWPQELKKEARLAVHPATDVDHATVATGKTYTVTPGKGGEKMYGLLVDLIASHPELAFVTVWAWSSPKMYRLSTFRDALVMNEVAWPEHVKAPAVPALPAVNDQERQLGETLLGTAVADFDADAYTDARTGALADLVAGGPALTLVQGTKAKPADDLTSMLEAALAAAGAA